MQAADIQRMLDNFDAQLAEGRIDFDTYQQLTGKWQERLAQVEGGALVSAQPVVPAAPAAAAAAAGPAPAVALEGFDVQQLKCPQCGAPPAQPPARDEEWVTCGFCRHKYRIESRRKQLDEAVQDWLRRHVSDAVQSTVVDEASRAVLFRDKLLPVLERDFNRALEGLSGFEEKPLFYNHLAEKFSSASPAGSPLMPGDGRMGPVKELSARLASPAVKQFALSGDSRRRLKQMDRRMSQLLHAANVLQQTIEAPVEGAGGAQRSLEEMKREHQDALVDASPAEKEFRYAAMARLEAASMVIGAMADIAQGASPEAMAERLDQAVELYRQAIERAEQSGHSPIERVPWRHGVEKELALAQVQASMLRAFGRTGAARPDAYGAFEQRVWGFVQAAGIRLNDPSQLEFVVAQLGTLLRAARNSQGLPKVADWDWVADRVESERKKATLGFLGVNEAHEGTVHFWRPFWAAGVSFSRAEGAVFQKGSEKQALLLLDALSPGSARVSLLEGDKGGPFEAALHRDVIDNRLTLPSLTDEAAAKRMLESWARGRTDLPHARVRIRGLIYLPAIVAQYSSKQGSRTRESTLAEQIFEDTSGLRAATVKFVESYARLA